MYSGRLERTFVLLKEELTGGPGGIASGVNAEPIGNKRPSENVFDSSSKRPALG